MTPLEPRHVVHQRERSGGCEVRSGSGTLLPVGDSWRDSRRGSEGQRGKVSCRLTLYRRQIRDPHGIRLILRNAIGSVLNVHKEPGIAVLELVHDMGGEGIGV